MAMLNVNRKVIDPFYRYKMPRLDAKVEGKGNGIKTVIVNMVDVAKALNRPPMYPTKWFGCVLGAQVNSDLKNERYIVNGAHESSRLQELLDSFIQKYVLCGACENPETVLSVSSKKGTIGSTCKACGHSCMLPVTDRLATYILKCPPTQSSGGAGSGASVQASGKKSKRKAKDGKNGGGGGKNGDSNERNGSPHSGSDGDLNGGDVDDDWVPEEDTDADAVARRMEAALSAGTKALMMNDDLEKSSEERIQIFYDFLKKKKSDNNGGGGGPMDATIQKEIVCEAERLEVKEKAVIVLCELLFDEPIKILQQIKTHRLLFLRFTSDNSRAQKYLLRGIELTIKEFKDQLIVRVPHILKQLYDLDILDEKVLIEWGSKVQKKNVGKEIGQEIYDKSQPFIKWLKEAEEEDDSDDDSDNDEDLEVVYDERIRPDKIIQIEDNEDMNNKNNKSSLLSDNNNKLANNNNSAAAADDIDIDAI